MPGKGNAMGHAGHGGGNKHEGQDAAIGQHTDSDRGRSASSPGHLKKDAGARSARDFAPGNLRHADRATTLPEAAPDSMGKD